METGSVAQRDRAGSGKGSGFTPADRTRRPGSLTLSEREEISRGLAAGVSLRTIAAGLGRPASTISREVGRHGGVRRYRAADAEARAWDNARRPKTCLLARSPSLQAVVAAKLALDWSPQQISGWLARSCSRGDGMYVSHETIYKSLFVQARGVLRKELIAHLRSRRTMRRAKTASTAGQARGQIRDAVSIRERPAEVEDRAVPGHWEGDLITGSHNSHIATLVERHSRYLLLVRVPGKDTASVVSALARQVRTLPDGLMASLTWDRGTELADHKRFTVATDRRVLRRSQEPVAAGIEREYCESGGGPGGPVRQGGAGSKGMTPENTGRRCVPVVGPVS
jgi:IS30 family transposase